MNPVSPVWGLAVGTTVLWVMSEIRSNRRLKYIRKYERMIVRVGTALESMASEIRDYAEGCEGDWGETDRSLAEWMDEQVRDLDS